MRPIKKQEIEKLENIFESYNVSRIYKATTIFSDNECTFFNLVPLLLHFNFHTIKELPCSPSAPCGIFSFSPQKMHFEALNHFFPDSEPVSSRKDTPILSIALVGSLGTVAQTEQSDFDYEIFVHKNKLSMKQLLALENKVKAIEGWANQKFDIEAHFFIEDIDNFKKNKFGETDKERVGSALGKLFKDEFYRTAIFIAGKRPLWWITPPDIYEVEIGEFKKFLRSTQRSKMGKFLDLGHVVQSDCDEFFGGALWQINKSLKSAFKSLLKMGLLEYYLFHIDGVLLCTTLKETLLKQNKELYEIDPYLMMSDQIIDYYTKRNMPKEANILKYAFLLKTGLTVQNIDDLIYLCKEECSETQNVLRNFLSKWRLGKHELLEFEQEFNSKQNLSFQHLNEIDKFFLDIYIRLSDWLKNFKSDMTFINEKDITVLGRKLFAHFKFRQGKIPVSHYIAVSFKDSKHISLIAGFKNGGDITWSLYDCNISGIKSEDLDISDNKENNFTPVIQMDSMIQILAYMSLNQIWKHKCSLYFESRGTSYYRDDIIQILENIYTFFIKDSKFEPSRKDYLSDCRTVKALIIPNFGLDHSPGLIKNVVAILLNSWGEYEFNYWKPKDSFSKIAKMMIFSENSKKGFYIRIVIPSSQNDPRLINEFEKSVDKAKRLNNGSLAYTKKTKLDL